MMFIHFSFLVLAVKNKRKMIVKINMSGGVKNCFVGVDKADRKTCVVRKWIPWLRPHAFPSGSVFFLKENAELRSVTLEVV